jgi:hypothetical protein
MPSWDDLKNTKLLKNENKAKPGQPWIPKEEFLRNRVAQLLQKNVKVNIESTTKANESITKAKDPTYEAFELRLQNEVSEVTIKTLTQKYQDFFRDNSLKDVENVSSQTTSADASSQTTSLFNIDLRKDQDKKFQIDQADAIIKAIVEADVLKLVQPTVTYQPPKLRDLKAGEVSADKGMYDAQNGEILVKTTQDGKASTEKIVHEYGHHIEYATDLRNWYGLLAYLERGTEDGKLLVEASDRAEGQYPGKQYFPWSKPTNYERTYGYDGGTELLSTIVESMALFKSYNPVQPIWQEVINAANKGELPSELLMWVTRILRPSAASYIEGASSTSSASSMFFSTASTPVSEEETKVRAEIGLF